MKIEEAWGINQTILTIYSKTIVSCTNDELIGDLKKENPGIIAAEIQQKWENEILVNTPIAKVTIDGRFNEYQLENMKLRLHFQSLSVRLYIPRPSRCKMCWSYEHFSSKKYPCKGQKVCGNCTEKYHLNKKQDKCEFETRCLHCGGPHPAWDNQCKKYKTEQAIWKKATIERISVKAARFSFATEKARNKQTMASRLLNQERQDYDTLIDNNDNIYTQNNSQNEIKKLTSAVADLQNIIHDLCQIVTSQLNLKSIPAKIHNNNNSADNDHTPSESFSLNLKHTDSLIQQQRNFDIASSLNGMFQSAGARSRYSQGEGEEDMDEGEDEPRRTVKRGGEAEGPGPPLPKRQQTIRGTQEGEGRGESLFAGRGNNNPPASHESNRGSRRRVGSSGSGKESQTSVS